MFSPLPQNNTYAWSLHQHLHHPGQHPLHLCHLLLHQSEKQKALMNIISLADILDNHHYHMSSANVTNGINSVLSDPLFAACIQVLPSCLSDCNQENSPVSYKQHTGGRLHHPPPLHFILCKHGRDD